jgi:serine/threonine-protein kinase
MSSTGSPKQLAPGDVFAGKYRLERQFAAGGMGFVWRAWNMQLDIPVAVKVMASAAAESPDFVARFELEAKAAAQIRSPNVVSIYEHGVHERLPYMVMELLEGEDLSQRLKRDKRLSMVTTAHIVRDMCKALHRAHELGIVHRDIKPANVFLARDGDEEIVKVLDFGIAKRTLASDGNLTATGELMGTPSYMSPEHIRASKRVDHRADLWSASVIAFRALTGQLPFTGQILDVVDCILTGSAPAPSSIAGDLSPAVDAFFARALARDIDHRFQSARELSDALGKLVGRESVVAISELIDAPVASDRLPTIAVARPPATPISPAAEPPEVNTLIVSGRGSPLAVNAPRGPTRAELKSQLRTLPMDGGARTAAELALAEAMRRNATRAAPPAPPPPPATPSPWIRAAASAPVAPARPQRRSWTGGVVLASMLVVIVVAFWATRKLLSGQPSSAAPLPATSTH